MDSVTATQARLSVLLSYATIRKYFPTHVTTDEQNLAFYI
jgi:hypothetical protein